MRQAQPRPGADVEPNTGPDPSQQGLQQRRGSEPGEIRGILRKSPSGGPEWDRDRDTMWEGRQQDQNGGGERGNGVEERRAERHDNVPVPRRERPASSAPWRQRNRNRRETVAVCAQTGHPQSRVTPRRRGRWTLLGTPLGETGTQLTQEPTYRPFK